MPLCSGYFGVQAQAFEPVGEGELGLDSQAVERVVEAGFVVVPVHFRGRAEELYEIGLGGRRGEELSGGEARGAVTQARMGRIAGVGRDEEGDVIEAGVVVEFQLEAERRIEQSRAGWRDPLVAIRAAEGAGFVQGRTENQGPEREAREVERGRFRGWLGPVGETGAVAESEKTNEGAKHGGQGAARMSALRPSNHSKAMC